MTDFILKPKRPAGTGWLLDSSDLAQEAIRRAGVGSWPCEVWLHRQHGICVFSAVEVAREAGQPDLGPEYHLSISQHGGRISAADALWVLAQFDLLDAKEDNHVPHGLVRNFWRPVADRLSGYECPCQGEEPAIREDKGDYVWRGVTK
ncbi:hypothetical protein [Cupriavidus necator]|nr:hypothetical protein [Cupriavidus necator]MDX6014734.1 hypothetical protein [Cupriavidus necator]